MPSYLLEIPDKYGVHIDVMIEAKKKNKLFLDYMKNIPNYRVRFKIIFKYSHFVNQFVPSNLSIASNRCIVRSRLDLFNPANK